MPSTYSTNLKIELQANGENSTTWGTITNTNLGTALEQAIVGYGNPSYASDANLTLSYTDTNAAQAARALVLNVTSAVSLSTTRELVVPTIQKQYIVQNNTSGSQSITVKTAAGSGVTVPNGRKAHLYVNGTDVIYMDDYVDINGGSIDGTTIGGSSAAAGTFTTLGATTGNITTVNATTVDTTNIEVTNIKAKDGTSAATIADSTGVISLTANPTLSGGTANGVLYLNGSKVATSGSALVFDGTNLGLGTSTPSKKLDIRANVVGESALMLISNDNASGTSGSPTVASIEFASAGVAKASIAAAVYGNDWLSFRTGSNTERMRLDSSGVLLLGNTSNYNVGSAENNSLQAKGPIVLAANNTGSASNRNWAFQTNAAAAGSFSLAYSSTNTGWPNAAYALVVDSSGNLGIGTASPGSKLDVSGGIRATSFATNTFAINTNPITGVGTSAQQLRFLTTGADFYLGVESSTGGSFFPGSTAYAGVLYNSASTPIQFYTAGTLRATLTSGGNFGLGTTSPQRPLHVYNSNVAVGEYTVILQGAQGGYGAGISFQSVLQGSSTLAEMCRITADGESAWDGTAANQDANLRFYTAIDGSVAERMRLTAGGLLSLWDVNGDKFQLNGLAANSYKLSKFAGGGQYGDSEFRITAGNTASGSVTFSSGGTTRAIIDKDGNFGLGAIPNAWSGMGALQIGDVGTALGYIAADSGGSTVTNIGHGAYWDGTNWKYVATSVGATRYQMTGANAGSTHQWFTSAGGTAGNNISFGDAKMTLDASGNLLVGGTSTATIPTLNRGVYLQSTTNNDVIGYSLHIPEGSNNRRGSMFLDDANGIFGWDVTASSGIPAYAWRSAGRTDMFLDASGNLLVGTTTTSTTSGTGFKVFANLGITGHFDASVVSAANSSSYSCWDLYSTGAGAYRFYVGTDGTVNATNTTISAISDQRLKENIRDLDVGLDAVMALKPRKFDWKEGKGQDKKNVRGFIAQEFEQVFPDLIDEWKDPAPEGEEPYKSVRQDLIPVLVKAIQELKTELDAAKVKIAALEAK